MLSTRVDSEHGASVSFGTGGGSFGLHFGDGFHACSTSKCATFNNAPLVDHSANCFAPIHVEAYEFTPPAY